MRSATSLRVALSASFGHTEQQADSCTAYESRAPRVNKDFGFKTSAPHWLSKRKATKRDSILILGLSRLARRRNKRRFSGVSFRHGGTELTLEAPCAGFTGENPMSSLGPHPRIRHKRRRVETLGSIPPLHAPVYLGVRTNTSGYFRLSHSCSLACLPQLISRRALLFDAWRGYYETPHSLSMEAFRQEEAMRNK